MKKYKIKIRYLKYLFLTVSFSQIYTYTFSLTPSHPLSRSLSVAPSIPHSLTLSLFLGHTHTHFIPPPTLARSRSVSAAQQIIRFHLSEETDREYFKQINDYKTKASKIISLVIN